MVTPLRGYIEDASAFCTFGLHVRVACASSDCQDLASVGVKVVKAAVTAKLCCVFVRKKSTLGTHRAGTREKNWGIIKLGVLERKTIKS